jgi:hypothetical protein
MAPVDSAPYISTPEHPPAVGPWLSLGECLNGIQAVVSSSLLSSTKRKTQENLWFLLVAVPMVSSGIQRRKLPLSCRTRGACVRGPHRSVSGFTLHTIPAKTGKAIHNKAFQSWARNVPLLRESPKRKLCLVCRISAGALAGWFCTDWRRPLPVGFSHRGRDTMPR